MSNDIKVYSISLKGSSHSYALTHLHADQFHGVHCLKGIARATKKESSSIEGRRIYIPVAEIAAITEYDSWDDFTKKAGKPSASKMMKNPVKSKKRR